MKHYIPLLAILFLFSCKSKEAVDLLIYNAKIYTVDANFSQASTLAVKNGVFVAVSNDNLDNYDAKEKLDASGKTIIPGLIDAHCHFYGLGLNQQVVNLRGTTSYQDILEKVETFQKEKPSNFIRGLSLIHI